MSDVLALLANMRARVKRGGIELLPVFRSFDTYVSRVSPLHGAPASRA